MAGKKMVGRWGRVVTVLAVLAGWPGAGRGEEADLCAAPEDLTLVNYPIDRVYEKIKAQVPVKILILGSTSSQSSPAWASKGLPSIFNAYPRQLERELLARAPGLKVVITDRTEAAQTAAAVAVRLDRLLGQFRPDLVIWEAGTTDAVHRIDVKTFGQALDDGLHRLRVHGTDVILVDIQFSPQTESLYDFQPYLDSLWQLGEAGDANVLHRFDLMRHYSDTGRFNPGSTDPQEQLRNANFVHGCLASHLAQMILTAAQQPRE